VEAERVHGWRAAGTARALALRFRQHCCVQPELVLPQFRRDRYWLALWRGLCAMALRSSRWRGARTEPVTACQ
jgi:hypothetical protein